MGWVETDTLSNQSIAAYLPIGVYTATADGIVYADISLDQIQGNGDYYAYITRQIAGAGSAYLVGPITTIAAPSGQLSLAAQTIGVTVRTGDVLTAYVKGLAGDSATVDTITRWYVWTPAAASDVTVTLAVTAAQAAAAATGSLALTLFDTFLPTAITSTTSDNLTTAGKIWFAIKLEVDDDDTQALIFVEKTAGLTRVAGVAYGTPTHGSITLGGVSGAWTFTLYLSSTVTALLENYVGSAKAAIKYELATGQEKQIWSGDVTIDYGIIQALGAVA